MVIEFNKGFLGNQPHQMYETNQHFEDHLSPHYQGCDMSPEPMVPHIQCSTNPGHQVAMVTKLSGWHLVFSILLF
jgi:hypothetical protein